MSDRRRPVKRSYDASGRRAQAARQRTAALDAAGELFLARGYAATTVDDLAAAAGVSTATIYKTYGGKVGLVRELCTRALRGTGQRPAEERSDELRASAAPLDVIAGWAAFVAEISPRISPLLLVLRAAAQVDPEAAALREELDAARLTRMEENADALARRGALRADVTTVEARDVLWFCSSPDLYELLVVRRGWTLDRVSAFVERIMAGALL